MTMTMMEMRKWKTQNHRMAEHLVVVDCNVTVRLRLRSHVERSQSLRCCAVLSNCGEIANSRISHYGPLPFAPRRRSR